MSRTEAFNIPRTIRLDSGRSLRVRALQQFEWGTLAQYLADHVPSPLEVARRNLDRCPGLSRQDRSAILYEAAQEPWPPRAYSPAWRKALDRAPDQDGITAVLLQTMIPDDLNPGIDRAAIRDALTLDDFGRLFGACNGFDPEPDGEGDDDPKARGATTTAPAGTTTSTGGPSPTDWSPTAWAAGPGRSAT